MWLEGSEEGRGLGETGRRWPELICRASWLQRGAWLFLCTGRESQEGFEEGGACRVSVELVCGEWTEGPGGGGETSQEAAEQTQVKDDGGHTGQRPWGGKAGQILDGSEGKVDSQMWV